MHTKGPWENGNVGDAIISKHPNAIAGPSYTKDVLDYYGGAVICESVNSEDKPIIKAAPEMYEAMKRIPQQRHGSFEDGWTVFLTGYQMKAIEDILLKAEGREG